jgi:hypothetical protein
MVRGAEPLSHRFIIAAFGLRLQSIEGAIILLARAVSSAVGAPKIAELFKLAAH